MVVEGKEWKFRCRDSEVVRDERSASKSSPGKEGKEVSEAQNLQQQIEEQTRKSAEEFYGDSLGRIKGQLQNDRAQLESLAEQSSPDAQAQLQEMADSYSEIEDTLDQAAQDQGLEDVVDEAAQGTAAGGAAQQAQELGVDLSQVQGSGAEGRITVKDVTSAANQ